jgi:hypothetical protein
MEDKTSLQHNKGARCDTLLIFTKLFYKEAPFGRTRELVVIVEKCEFRTSIAVPSVSYKLGVLVLR